MTVEFPCNSRGVRVVVHVISLNRSLTFCRPFVPVPSHISLLQVVMAHIEALETAESFSETNHVPTRVLSVDRSDIYDASFDQDERHFLESFRFSLREGSTATSLEEAAGRLRNSDIPVAFPTETVYGLGAIATKSSAVQGIFAAKRRP